MKNFFDIKDKAVFLGWITGLLTLTALLWILTQSLQSYYLLRTVNNVFIAADDSRRLAGSTNQTFGKTGLMGYWYSMYNSTDKMFVFAVFQDGILVPLGAIVSSNGKVDEVIPLSAHAVQTFDILSHNVLKLYVTRIEAAAFANLNREGRTNEH